MKSRKEKSFRPVFSSIWFTMVILAILGWLFLGIFKISDLKQSVQSEVDDINGKIDTIERDNQRLEREVSYFQDPNYLERAAKEKLNYKAPDETVYFVYLDQNSKASNSLNKTASSQWQKWFRYLLGD